MRVCVYVCGGLTFHYKDAKKNKKKQQTFFFSLHTYNQNASASFDGGVGDCAAWKGKKGVCDAFQQPGKERKECVAPSNRKSKGV